jgi:hypothetical protein
MARQQVMHKKSKIVFFIVLEFLNEEIKELCFGFSDDKGQYNTAERINSFKKVDLGSRINLMIIVSSQRNRNQKQIKKRK